MCKNKVEDYLGQVKRLILEDDSIIKGLIFRKVENDVELMLFNGNIILIGLSSIKEIRPTKVKTHIRAKFKDIYISRKKIEKHLDMIEAIKKEINAEKQDFSYHKEMLLNKTGFVVFNSLIDDNYKNKGYSVDVITDDYDCYVKQIIIKNEKVVMQGPDFECANFIKREGAKFILFKTSDKYKDLLNHLRKMSKIDEIKLLSENLDILNTQIIDSLNIIDNKLIYSKKLILNVNSIFKNRRALEMIRNISKSYISDLSISK